MSLKSYHSEVLYWGRSYFLLEFVGGKKSYRNEVPIEIAFQLTE